MTDHFPDATKMMETVKALKRLKVQTNSLACFGCGLEHNCGIHGCRIIRDAVELIEALKTGYYTEVSP